MNKPFELSRRERQIMDVLFAAGPATVAEIRGQMADPPSDNAVRTFLTILQQKGHARRSKGGQPYRWSAVRRRDRAGRDDLKRVIQTFFDGSLANAFTAYLADRKTELSKEELERLRQVIEQVREKGE